MGEYLMMLSNYLTHFGILKLSFNWCFSDLNFEDQMVPQMAGVSAIPTNF